MSWKDSKELASFFEARFDDGQRDRLYALYAVHYFLYVALPSKEGFLSSSFDDAIVVSDYGKRLISQIDVSSYDKQDVVLACVINFFHQDFLIDINASNPNSALAMLGNELASGSVRLPARFGRTLYDRFNALPDRGRIEYLAADDVDALLRETEQGNYQIGKFTAGPSRHTRKRRKPLRSSSRRVPLWHCADPGRQYLHNVTLRRYDHPLYLLANEIFKAANTFDGPESNWDKAIARMLRRSAGISNKEYYDLPILLADGFSSNERALLIIDALKGRAAQSLRHALKIAADHVDVKQLSPESVARKLTNGQTLQLLMTLTDADLVYLIDRAAWARRIRIPSSETRKAKSSPPELSNYDSTSSLSELGIRSNREDPILFLAATIWDEYENSGQLPELVWRCHMGSTTPEPGLPIAYMKTHTARETVRNLILPSRPITLAVAAKLKLELPADEPDEEIIDKFLWKFGFDFARLIGPCWVVQAEC